MNILSLDVTPSVYTTSLFSASSSNNMAGLRYAWIEMGPTLAPFSSGSSMPPQPVISQKYLELWLRQYRSTRRSQNTAGLNKYVFSFWFHGSNDPLDMKYEVYINHKHAEECVWNVCFPNNSHKHGDKAKLWGTKRRSMKQFLDIVKFMIVTTKFTLSNILVNRFWIFFPKTECLYYRLSIFSLNRHHELL
jgi:hypothetical protein